MLDAVSSSGCVRLTSRELLGLLSARLVHCLSNHMMIVTANLAAASQLQSVQAEETGKAIESALRAANEAGQLLQRFADIRRAARDDSGTLAVEDLPKLLEKSGQKHRWKLESCITSSGRIPLNAELLLFALNMIDEELGEANVRVRLSSGGAQPSGVRLFENHWLEFNFFYDRAEALDWSGARTTLGNVRLSTVYEIFVQAGGRIEWLGTELERRSFVLRLPMAPK